MRTTQMTITTTTTSPFLKLLALHAGRREKHRLKLCPQFRARALTPACRSTLRMESAARLKTPGTTRFAA
ncbi:MAG TPA: hypothetical protein PKA41_15610 [Verrucomicrobiota bacterium]|nr:hypothetical protein [Verrucomicrobiota bacterium]